MSNRTNILLVSATLPAHVHQELVECHDLTGRRRGCSRSAVQSLSPQPQTSIGQIAVPQRLRLATSDASSGVPQRRPCTRPWSTGTREGTPGEHARLPSKDTATALRRRSPHRLSARHLPVPPHMSHGTTPDPAHSRHRGSADASGAAPPSSAAADPAAASPTSPSTDSWCRRVTSHTQPPACRPSSSPCCSASVGHVNICQAGHCIPDSSSLFRSKT
jgi:hypothetical protein